MAAEHFYVQVRDSAQRRWVSVAESADRHTAERLAAEASRLALDRPGGLPADVRVMSTEDLTFEGGAAAVTRAATDLPPHPAIP